MREAVKHLRTAWLGQSYTFFEELDSTNSYLAALAANGSAHSAPHGAVVAAGYQSQGRGRGRRRWLAPPHSSLLFSMLLYPNWPAARAPWLTMIAALAVVETIERAAPLTAALKWPNDIMLRPTPQAPWHKVGGILLETGLDGERLQQAIVGIGLNVNIPAAELPPATTPAASLLLAAGQRFDLGPLFAAILQRLEAHYERAAAGQSPQPAWDARLITRDQTVRVSASGQTLQGLALGSDAWGRLLVRDAQGVTHAFAAADVSLI